MDRFTKTSRPIGALAQRSRWIDRIARRAGTIRGRILIAFLVMTIITGALGGYATLQLQQAGALVSKTFDQSLMSINYARAAAADFATMRAALGRRWQVAAAEDRQSLDKSLGELKQSLDDDLRIAAERSQSARAARAAEYARRAAADWDALRTKLGEGPDSSQLWKTLEARATTVDQEIDLLVNYTAGDGFTYRQSARALVAQGIQTNLILTGCALGLSMSVAWLLTRRIVGPVALASTAARQIADGKLDCLIPAGSSDELGALLLAMGVMRDNLRSMMEREVTLRRSAQRRLIDAVESLREGIVLVDAAGLVVLANRQFLDFVGRTDETLPPGTPLSTLDLPLLVDGATGRHPSEALDVVDEARSADGRWLRISRSATQEGGFVAVLSNITLLKDQEERLRATNLSLDAALENMSQGLCLYDAERRLRVVNRRFLDLFGLDPARVTRGLAFVDVLDLRAGAGLDTLPAEHALLVKHAEGGRAPAGMMFEDHAHGRCIAIVHRPTIDGGFVLTYEDVTERRRAEAEILFMARHDALTRLPNRVLFTERTEQALAQVGRGRGFAVLCLDLDHFKQLNEILGHSAGDALLKRIAERLGACLRDADTVARFGGDEFAILQADVGKLDETIALARRIVESIGAPIDLSGQMLSVGVSLGIALAPADGTTCADLLKNADAALNRAKADGRGTWRCFEPAMDARLKARRALELDLREALAREQTELYYQPLYDLNLDQVCGFEALVRWNHPHRGLVMPGEFIPVAEEMGLIAPLGEWVLRRACDEARRWPAHIKVAVNVSPAQFKSPRLVRAICEALATAGLAPNRLELEITETVLLAENSATLDILHNVRGLGVRVSMDDFGTGYSSLSYLRSFPFDKIKIDQSFVRELTTKDESGVIVRAITRLGSSLGMRTTAEGVETFEQLARLRVEGCNEAQGYLFSRPVPAREVPALIERWPGKTLPGTNAAA